MYSYNEESKEVEISPVTALFAHKDSEYLEVTLETGTKIEVTSGHPFYNPETGKWQEIGNFKAGDYVMNKDNNRVRIESIEEIGNKETVYNLEVDGNHNYFVTKDNILVHNKT